MKALTKPNRYTYRKELSRDRGLLQVSGCVRSQKTHLICALSGGSGRRVIVCASESRAREMYEEYRFLAGTPSCIRPRTSCFTRRTCGAGS